MHACILHTFYNVVVFINVPCFTGYFSTADQPAVEAQIFYEKMKADYYRYLTEFAQGKTRDGNLFANDL